jgi:hypothetical protein
MSLPGGGESSMFLQAEAPGDVAGESDIRDPGHCLASVEGRKCG